MANHRPPNDELPPALPPHLAERHGATPWAAPSSRSAASGASAPRPPERGALSPLRPHATASARAETAEQTPNPQAPPAAYAAPIAREVTEFRPAGGRGSIAFLTVFVTMVIAGVAAVIFMAASDDPNTYSGPVSLYGHAPPAVFPGEEPADPPPLVPQGDPRLDHPAERGKFAR